MELIKENIYLVRNKKIFSSNTYVLTNKINDECILIDPGFDVELLEQGIEKLKLKPIAIISTHGHFDHIGGVSVFKNKFNIPFYLHEADLKLSQSANFYLKVAQLDHKIETPKPDFLFKSKQEELKINSFVFNIHNFPGHSAGSCVIKIHNYIFTGDIMYKSGLGPESIPKEDKKLLKKSIAEIFDTFENNDIVLPGHGPFDELGSIKQNNLELKSFITDTTNAGA